MKRVCFPAPRRLLRDERGVSALEFALVAPVVLLILAAVVDFGTLIHTRTRLEIAASGATSYALAAGQGLKPENAAQLGENTARALLGQMGEGLGLEITLNKSFITSYAGASLHQSGSTNAANLCYCPRRSDTGIEWGEPMACGVACPDGGMAGKFIAVRASLPYRPLFADYGLVENDVVSIQTMAVLQ